MVSEQESNNINGWLSFFIATLVLISPIYNVYLLYTQIEFLPLIDLIERLAIISLFILAGIFLWTKKPYALKFAKIFLTTQLIINVLVSYINSDFSNFISTNIYFVIWILYLIYSEKVRQIYGNLKEKSSGMQIWPILAIIYAFFAPIYGVVFAIIALINIFKNRKLRGLLLSIIALIISIVYLFLIFGYGTLEAARFDYVPESIEMACSDFCSDLVGPTLYYLEYSKLESGFICYCMDNDSNILEKKRYYYQLE